MERLGPAPWKMGGYECSLQTDEQHLEPCDDQGSTHLTGWTADDATFGNAVITLGDGQSITLNGVTTTLNKTYSPFSAPGWWGVVVNFQLDGNYNQSDYSVYLDKFNFTYY